MLLIGVVFNDQALNFKAPKNMMYKISGINFSNDSPVGGQIRIFDEQTEDNVDFTSKTGFIASFGISVDGNSHFIDNIDHTTKFISILKNVAATVNVDIQIYGDLVKASKTDLIIEWFRKGR